MAETMTMEISAPAPLTLAHNTSLFSCGKPALDAWLRHRAMKNETSGASRTYVLFLALEHVRRVFADA